MKHDRASRDMREEFELVSRDIIEAAWLSIAREVAAAVKADAPWAAKGAAAVVARDHIALREAIGDDPLAHTIAEDCARIERSLRDLAIF